MKADTHHRSEILRIRDLQVHYETRHGVVKAVDRLSLSLYAGERFGLVGESGSGKSTTVLALLRMIPRPGQIVGGEVILDGVHVMALSEEAMRTVRLARMSLVPQGAMNALNPVMRIRAQMIAAMKAHDEEGSGEEMEARVAELLEWVGLKRSVALLYPHELSGGMKQRVCIAIAISLRPQLIIADEPTSALDVIVQRQIMHTLHAVQARLGASVLLVGHDMGLMAQFVDRMGVMYGGRLVEVGEVGDIFKKSLHPYTQLLISSIPSFERKGDFRGIPGQPVSLQHPPTGCLFHPRCPKAMGRCSSVVPPLMEVRSGQSAACLLYEVSTDGPSA